MYYTKQSLCSTIHRFYLDDAIVHREVYREFIDVLYSVPEQDEVHIYINTPGGNVSIGITMINAMRNCQAKLVGHLTAECHSMGTFIFLACDEWVVNEDVHLLFHAYSGWNYGKGNDSVTSAQENHKWLSTFFKKVYYPFFSHEELEELMPEDNKGATDFYLGYEEMVERLKVVVKHREELQEEAKAKEMEMIMEALTSEETGSEDIGVLHTAPTEEFEVSEDSQQS